MILANDDVYRITGRSEVPGNPNLIRVLFEHDESLIIQVRDFVDFSLKVNETLSYEDYKRILLRSSIVHALTLAQKYLRMRVKTSAQVSQYLKQKGIENEIIESVLRHLNENHIVDDEQYASIYVSTKNSSLSRRVLMNKLNQKGVSQDIIQETISQMCDDNTEFEAALCAAKKYVKHHGVPASRDEKLKMGGSLARKGFSQSVVFKIIDNMDRFIQ